ncbi:M16 family metallopeptidase [Pedobacter sp. MR22-3]|uniref:M16 family metallopeptidase n=1 Tax=Pedobacter sp. MR22-3 TaxID=2994552 RepID=UPI0022465107|nr:M16 family metallopeptidase [Pedobacter sp. MR22-3]MCX2584452.1 insulinase family protein [Pedobacter sp. MR22-3]
MLMRYRLVVFVMLFLTHMNLMAQSEKQWNTGFSGGYTYKYVSNDPTKSRFYILKNGLTVVLSQNTQHPVIEFRLAVRAGSNTDPKTATGLAHYLEHLLFKGTDKFGTLNYAKEKPLLDKIDSLYGQYGRTVDPVKRKEIYAEIDKVSGEASNFAIANEYDRMMKSIGGKTTNAHTLYEGTDYNEDFPSNAVDQFLALQAERFRHPVFRLFHTELEAVYEEKNSLLDDDNAKTDEKVLAALFPTHNYGQQTVIGTIAHLKNPSLTAIREYYNKYYVPNNMVVAFAGDFIPDEMIKKVDRAFAYMKAKPFQLYNPAPEKPLTKVQRIDVYGPNKESVKISYRGYAQNTKESMLLKLISSIMSNDKAGILDIQLNQQQKVQSSGANYQQMKDYGVFGMYVVPKQGQRLDEAQNLLLGQIGRLKHGDFDESLIKAIVANNKLNLLYEFADNGMRVNAIVTEFVLNRGINWDKTLNMPEAMAGITKKEIVEFSNKFFKNNYVVAYKHQGEDKETLKVEKPTITPVNTNPSAISTFAKNIYKMSLKPISPKFLDYKKDLNLDKVGIADVVTVQNVENSLFSLSYKFDIGSWNLKLLPYAAQYLNFLSTDKYTVEEIKRQFYTIACDYNFSVENESATISITGLQENFDKAVKLVEYIFANCKANEQALAELKNGIIKERENNKLSKEEIFRGMSIYAQYGANNPFNDKLSNKEIQNISSADLLSIIHNFSKYKHTITYYGPKTLAAFKADIGKLHPLPDTFAADPVVKKFNYTTMDKAQVYFVPYNMVQAEVCWVHNNGGPYDPTQAAKINLFNSYFGQGMSSVVFQTIRGSKALAYSTGALYSSPKKKAKEYTMFAYLTCQADKMGYAINSMNELLNNLPREDHTFEVAKANALNEIETERINKEEIIKAYFRDKQLGIDHDSRIEQYAGLKALNFSDIKVFHEQKVANKPYYYCIMASEKDVKIEEMKNTGPVTKLSLEQIFGY